MRMCKHYTLNFMPRRSMFRATMLLLCCNNNKYAVRLYFYNNIIVVSKLLSYNINFIHEFVIYIHCIVLRFITTYFVYSTSIIDCII